MFRIYIVPSVGSDATTADARRPKYFADGTLNPNPSYTAQNYGFEPWFVVGADLSVSDDALVIGQSDAFALPFDLNSVLSLAQRNSVRAKLAAINVPELWVTTGMQWILVVRTVLGMFSFRQLLDGIISNRVGTPSTLFSGGVTLATTYSQLSSAVQADLQSAASAMQLVSKGNTGSTTMRAMLKIIADQFVGRQFIFGGVAL